MYTMYQEQDIKNINKYSMIYSYIMYNYRKTVYRNVIGDRNRVYCRLERSKNFTLEPIIHIDFPK